jgi:hypothetical protein
LSRPWDPGTCQTSQLRKEVWLWLEAVVTWLSHEHVWDVADLIPTAQALTSDPLEEWHLHSLPSFTERMRSWLRNHCQEDHQSWPAKGRYTRHLGEASRSRRMDAYAADVLALKSGHDQNPSHRLGLVDLETDEIKQLSDFDSHVYGRGKINA